MSLRPILLSVLLTCALAAGVSAAGAQTPPEHDPGIADGSLQRALDAARKTWKHGGLRSYSYDVRQSCFCPQQKTTLVIVRNGKIKKFPPGLKSVATVPRLFKLVQGFIDAGVASLDVTYSTRGVPRKIAVDRIAGAVDDEVGYSVKHFTPLQH
jgi:hypothetical protein